MSIFTVRDAAQYLGCTPAQVRRLIVSGRLSAVDISVSERKAKPRYRITQEAVSRFLNGAPVVEEAEAPPTRRKRLDDGCKKWV